MKKPVADNLEDIPDVDIWIERLYRCTPVLEGGGVQGSTYVLLLHNLWAIYRGIFSSQAATRYRPKSDYRAVLHLAATIPTDTRNLLNNETYRYFTPVVFHDDRPIDYFRGTVKKWNQFPSLQANPLYSANITSLRLFLDPLVMLICMHKWRTR